MSRTGLGIPQRSGARSPVRPVGPGLLLSLVAGRGAWRVAINLSNVGLLAAWGAAVFAGYASAVGRTVALIPLVSCGVEKAALKLLPRARVARPLLVAAFLTVGCLLALPFLAWVAAEAVWRRSGTEPLQLAVVPLQALLGLNLVLVGLARALGRPRHDPLNFLALAAALLLLTAMAAGLGLPPLGVVLAELAAVAALDIALLRALPVAPRFAGLLRRRGLLRGLLRTMALIGAYDVAVGASLSLVFVTLSATRFRGESGLLLLVISLWSLLFNGFAYLLRVFQPQVSVALRAGGMQARQHALRLARLAAVAVAGWLGLLGVAALLGGGLPAVLRGLPLPLAAALVLLPRLPVLALAGGATWLLENADPGSLRLAATAAAGGLAGVAILSAVLVPWLGAPGAMLALSGFEVVQVAVLLGGLNEGRRPGTGQPPGSRSAA
jgi:hypothetical protein